MKIRKWVTTMSLAALALVALVSLITALAPKVQAEESQTQQYTECAALILKTTGAVKKKGEWEHLGPKLAKDAHPIPEGWTPVGGFQYGVVLCR